MEAPVPTYRSLPVVRQEEREFSRCILCRGWHPFGCAIYGVHVPDAIYFMPLKREVNPEGRCEHFMPNFIGRELSKRGMRKTYTVYVEEEEEEK